MSRYRIGAEIGHGGLAVVHHASRRLADDRVQGLAVKRLRPDCEPSALARKRLDLEAAIGLTLSHPHIAKIYDYRRFGAERGIVMERVDGVSLFALARHQRLPHDVVRLVLIEVGMALGYVHELGILHRDISPSNILVSRTGQVKLADFGLARLAGQPTTSDGFKGTPPYASPEAIRGQRLDPGADMYSLAAVAYELLAGEPPYGWGKADEIARRQDPASGWHMPPLPADAPVDLRFVLTDLLRPRDQRRIPSADVLCEVLAEWAERTGYAAGKQRLAALVEAAREQATTRERAAGSGRRSRWPLHTIVTFGLLLGVGLGAVWQALPAPAPAPAPSSAAKGPDHAAPVNAPVGVEPAIVLPVPGKPERLAAPESPQSLESPEPWQPLDRRVQAVPERVLREQPVAHEQRTRALGRGTAGVHFQADASRARPRHPVFFDEIVPDP